MTLSMVGCAPQRPASAGEWNNVFERRDGFGWSGGDAAHSVPLPGNRTLWLFGDSYLSGIANGRRDRVEFRFGNTVAVQSNLAPGTPPTSAQLKFDWGAYASKGWLPIELESLEGKGAPPSAAHAVEQKLPVLSWPLHGIVVGNDLVLFNLPVTPFDCHTCGLLPLKVHGSMVTVIPGVDRPYEEWGFRPGVGWEDTRKPRPRFVPYSRAVEAMDDLSGLWWGTFVLRDPDDSEAIYIYGHRESKTEKALVVARILGVRRAEDLLDFDSWMFWDGRGWTADPDRALALLGESETEVSVVPVPKGHGTGFALLQTGDIHSGEIRVAMARHPWGPFVDRYRLSLENCPVMSGYDTKVPRITYAAKAHPELSTEDELLVSVITMPLVDGKVATVIPDPGQYVPRFIHLPWDEITSYAHSSAKRCDPAPAASAQPARR